MTARNTFFYILISLFAILALGCNKTWPNPFEDEGDTDIVDNDNNQENDTDLVDQFDETADESADEATDEAVDEATDEADNFDESNEDIDDESIDTEEDPLAQFRWVEGVWRCTAGGIGYINHEYNVRLLIRLMTTPRKSAVFGRAISQMNHVFRKIQTVKLFSSLPQI